MRGHLLKALTTLAGEDERIVFLTGDLGYLVVDSFRELYPDRFFNVGVAEQDMVGIATGLAQGGFIPFVYSIGTFAVLRPFEFIRNGPILHDLPVRIIGVGAGFDYGDAGPTHHVLEDLGALRMYPNLTIISPADGPQAEAALLASWELPGPVYYRIGKNDRELVEGLDGRFTLDGLHVLGKGSDLLIVTTGSVAAEAVAASTSLNERAIGCTVAILATINPIPERQLVDLLSSFSAVMTVEEHYRVGGIGSLVSEIVATRGLGCRLHCSGVQRAPEVSGSRSFLRDLAGLSSARLVDQAVSMLAR